MIDKTDDPNDLDWSFDAADENFIPPDDSGDRDFVLKLDLRRCSEILAMPKTAISIELPDLILGMIEIEAGECCTSVSEWIAENAFASLAERWPGWFDLACRVKADGWPDPKEVREPRRS